MWQVTEWRLITKMTRLIQGVSMWTTPRLGMTCMNGSVNREYWPEKTGTESGWRRTDWGHQVLHPSYTTQTMRLVCCRNTLKASTHPPPAHTYICTCTHMHIYTCIHVHTHIYMYIHVYMYIHMHTYTCTHYIHHTWQTIVFIQSCMLRPGWYIPRPF